jgi:hypothetical protein
MRTWLRTTSILLVLVAAAGCLQKETTHILYLSADGSVRWTVEETNVYSDEADAGARFTEEQVYIGPALIAAHRAALALQALGPDAPIRTTVVRDERPFHVVTDARFLRVDRAFERLFKQSGLRGSASLDRLDDRYALRIRLDFGQELEENDSPATALLEDFENFSFVLTEGRFIAGGGFDVPGRTKAVISREWIARMEEAMKARCEIQLVLTWTYEADGV